MRLTKARDNPNLSGALTDSARASLGRVQWVLFCIEIVSVNADAASSRAIEFYDGRLIKKVWGAGPAEVPS